MHGKKSTQLNIILVVVVTLALAALACNPVPSAPTSVPATEAPTEEAKPTDKAAPTEEGGGGAEATKVPAPIAKGINAKNVGNLHEVRAIAASTRALNAGAVSPTAPQGATFGNDRYVRIWNLDNGEMTYQLGPHAAEGWGLAFSPDGTKLASGGGFEVILWDPATGKKIKSVTVNAYVYRLNWSPDSRYLAVVGENSSKIDLIDAGTASVKTRISTPAGNVLWAAIYSPNGKWMAVGDYKGGMTVLDAASSAVVEEDSATAKGAAWDMEFSPDSKLLASCNGSGDIYFWDTSTWASIPELIKRDVHSDADPALSGCTDGFFSRGGDIYFSVGNNMVLNAWNAADGNLLQSMMFNAPIMTVSISGDGKLLAVALTDGSFHILSAD
jgi:WD40 repeat protein